MYTVTQDFKLDEDKDQRRTWLIEHIQNSDRFKKPLKIEYREKAHRIENGKQTVTFEVVDKSLILVAKG